MTTLTCSRCRERKPAQDFPASSHTGSLRDSWCRACKSAVTAAHNQEVYRRTLATATHKSTPWTDEQLRIVLDADGVRTTAAGRRMVRWSIPAQAAATSTGRTLFSINTLRQKQAQAVLDQLAQ